MDKLSKIEKICFRIGIIFLLIGFILLFKNIFFFTHLSVSSVCEPVYFEEAYSQEYTTAGQFEGNASTGNYTIVYYYDPDLPTIKHEECHLKQFRQHRFASCLIRPTAYFAEFECYTIEAWYELKEKISPKGL